MRRLQKNKMKGKLGVKQSMTSRTPVLSQTFNEKDRLDMHSSMAKTVNAYLVLENSKLTTLNTLVRFKLLKYSM